jgi:predicted Zn-dependent peptidase
LFTLKFKNAKLANGLEIIAECNDQAHTTALGYFVRTGARDETDAVSGVSHFLEHMVFKGTEKRSAERVNLEFDEIGADYNAFTSEETTVYHANVLPEYQNQTVELLGDIVRPSLREEDFDSEKKVIIEEIMMYEDQPPFGADDKCRAAFFGTHPLGKSVLGTVDSVGGLSVTQMRDYWRMRYCPSNIKLVATGKVDFDALVASADQVCGGWEPIEADRKTPVTNPQNSVQVITKESAAQEYIIHMADAPTVNDPLRYAAKGVAVIVGDETGSRLFWELVDQGHAEHASLHYYGYEDAGIFFTYVCCDPALTEENLAKIQKVYETVRKSGITEEELKQAKSKVASRIVLGSERPRGRLFSVGSNWLYRKEYRSVQDDLNTIKGITRDDCQNILDRFALASGTLFAVGPLEKLDWNWTK